MCVENDEHIKAVLNPAQVKRLNELVIQNMGLGPSPDARSRRRSVSEPRTGRLKEILPPLAPMDTRYEVAIAATERARPDV